MIGPVAKRGAIVARWKGVGHVMKLYFVCAVGLATIIPLLLSEFGYAPLQTFLAVLLIEICLYPSARYLANKDSGLPTMAILCAAYALQFAVPFFTRDATIELAQRELRYLSDDDVVAALTLAIVGVCALQVGYYWFCES